MLKHEAIALRQGRVPTPPSTALLEANEVATVMRETTEILQQRDEHQRMLLQELNHRVKNTLATVQSLARRTFKGDGSGRYERFEGRLLSLSMTDDLPAICAFNDAISSCSSIVWKRFARRSIRAPIMLPSSGVSSPFPMAARISPNVSAHSPGLDSGRVLKLTGTPFSHWHGPIDEEGQRGSALVLRAGLEQGGEDVGEFFGELAIEALARRLCQFDSLRPGSTVGVRHRAMAPSS